MLFGNVLFLLIIACAVLLLTGLVAPKAALFWYRQERTRKKVWQVYGLFLIVFVILFGLWASA